MLFISHEAVEGLHLSRFVLAKLFDRVETQPEPEPEPAASAASM